MFDGDVTQLDAETALTVAADLRTFADRAETKLLEVAAHFADLHPLPPGTRPGIVILPGMEDTVVYGGDGCPTVAEFAPAELGAALGLSTTAATALLGDALALRHRHSYVGTEHLLMAFFTEPDAIATKVLQSHDVTEEAVTTAVTDLIPDGALHYDGEPGFTARASHVLQGAVAEALELGHNYVGTEHLLLSFYRDSGGVAAKVLRQLGLDGETARAGVLDALSG